ncbi:MAG: polymer-forming cytoskeletal protein [Bacteroidales bacterium]
MAKQNGIEPTAYNIISSGTSFKGEFLSDGNLRIDGDFIGDIAIAGKLIVGKGGHVKGKIKCVSAELEGMVEVSELQVEELLSLKASANLAGEVMVDKISIEQGAIFVGSCTMPKETNVNRD